MPRIILRDSDRRILFFSHADLPDLDPHMEHVRTRFGGSTRTTIYSPTTLPAGIRLGAYLDDSRHIVAHRPHGTLRTVEERRDELNGLIDGHIESIRDGALLSVPADGQRRFHRHLRMLVQASLRDGALRDEAAWTFIQREAALQAWDFVDYSAREEAGFRACFGQAGAYALGWWKGTTRERALRASGNPPNPLFIPSQTTFDLRAASAVILIPTAEIDRTDATLRNAAHPWTARDTIVAKINERLPWYQPSDVATLSADPLMTPANLAGAATFSASQGYYTGSTTFSFLAFRPVLSSSRAIIRLAVNGVPQPDPFTVNAGLNRGNNQVVITVTAQDQETVMTYTYDINRTTG